MNLTVEVARSVAEIGPEKWDALAGETPFASYRWYRFGEAAKAEDAPLYIMVLQNGEPVARATFWLTWQEPLPVGTGLLRRLVHAIFRRWPLMICRAPLSSTSGLTLPDPPLRAAALEAIVAAALEQARAHHASFLLFDYLRTEEMNLAARSDRFTGVTIPDPGTCLPIRWTDFESYLQDLSQKTRKNYRRNCRAGEGLEIKVNRQQTVTDIDAAIPLIRNVEARHDSAPNPWVRGMLEHADWVDSVWLTATKNGRLVGCELMLGDRETWLVTAPGRDYSVSYVYFLLGYADIRFAIETGAQALRWGSCAYETKRRLGFQLEDNNHTVITANNRLLRALARRFM